MRPELRTLEVARLDQLQEGMWIKAESGDVRATLAIVRIIEARAKLMALALDPRAAAPQEETVVVNLEDLVSHPVS